MGSAVCCSKVETKANVRIRRSPRREKGYALKEESDFEACGYIKKERIGPDDKVWSAAKISDEAIDGSLQERYVLREIYKRTMPLPLEKVESHLSKLSNLDHIHICRFIEAFDSLETLQLVYEQASCRSVFEEDESLKNGQPLEEELAKAYCRQIVMALSVAHQQGIVHGRLNDRSLLVVDNTTRLIKLCDFGQTGVMRPVRRGTKLHFEAPENFWQELSPTSARSKPRSPKSPKSPNGASTETDIDMTAFMACDMWAVGVVAYRMLTGKLPFTEKEDIGLANAIKSSVLTFGHEWDAMPDARELIKALLKKNGRIRPTAGRALRSPWLAINREPISKGKMMRVLGNVVQNCTENTFKKFVLRVMAEDLDDSKLTVVEKAFQFIDKNCDGTLQMDEIKRALFKYYKDEDGAAEVADNIFEAIDRDLSGTLNFAEFTAVSIGRQEYTDKVNLWECFNRFDKDGNGEFSKNEIADVVRQVEHLTDGSLVEEVVQGIAEDIETPVDFDTFVQIMVTPAGQPISKMQIGWGQLCYRVFKVDTHSVRHIEPSARVNQANTLSHRIPHRNDAKP